VLVRQAAPALGTTPGQLDAAVGTIDGKRAVTILRTYINAYFDRYLRRRDNRILDGPSPRFPEIQFTRAS
jgi:hypothetical protein